MTLPWQRVAPIVYQCPACRSGDFLPVSAIFRPKAGQPWKLLPAGSLVRCVACGTLLAIGPGGVTEPGIAPSQRRPLEMAPNQREDPLTADMRMSPTEMGV